MLCVISKPKANLSTVGIILCLSLVSYLLQDVRGGGACTLSARHGPGPACFHSGLEALPLQPELVLAVLCLGAFLYSSDENWNPRPLNISQSPS